MRALAWTVAGASAGSVARRLLDPVWPGPGRSLANTFVLAAIAATVIGFALVGSSRAVVKTALVAAGGAAGSISAAATRAVTATPAQSVLGLAVFFVGAVVGVQLGIFVALAVRNPARRERC